MSRTVNEKRPAELLDAIVRYLLKHGLSDLSLRPLAKSVGSSPRVLLYYFGSKEELVAAVISNVRQRQFATLGQHATPSFSEACTLAWHRMSAPDSEPLFRLFFEAYGIALRDPKRYKSFLRDTIEGWVKLIAEPLPRDGYTPADARAFATIILAGLRGFMLDFCNTHDRKRLDRAVDLWAGSLDRILLECEKKPVCD